MHPETSTHGPVSRFLRSLTAFLGPLRSPPSPRTQVLVVVEGPNDIEFLRRISTILHRDDHTLPDLAAMERQNALVFVPSGGVDLSSAFRFAGLGLSEFHLLDRDMPPATQVPQQMAAMVNSRPRCCAVVTSKRSFENYLNSAAVFEVSGFQIAITDDANVPELVARLVNEGHESGVSWDDLTARARKRLCYRCKKWLNTRAVERMPAARLAERDGGGKVPPMQNSVIVGSAERLRKHFPIYFVWLFYLTHHSM